MLASGSLPNRSHTLARARERPAAYLLRTFCGPPASTQSEARTRYLRAKRSDLCGVWVEMCATCMRTILMQACERSHVYAYIYRRMHTYIDVNTYRLMHTYIDVCTHIQTYAYIYRRMYACTLSAQSPFLRHRHPTHARTQHTHTHTHTHTCKDACKCIACVHAGICNWESSKFYIHACIQT